MIYYVFDTEQDAISTESQIRENVRIWVATNSPEALSEDGSKLRGRNAATGQLEDVYTTRWAIPQQTNNNKWVFPKPTQDKTSPIPVEVFLQNIVALEEQYNSNWFTIYEF